MYTLFSVLSQNGWRQRHSQLGFGHWVLKSVHFKKPVTGSSFLSKSVVIFNVTTTNMTTLFERNENRVTGFLK